MTFIPAGIAALVTAYCLACVARPGWRDPGSRVDVDLGHAVMGATTLVMVLGVLPAAWAPGLLVLFAGAVVGCAIRGVRQVAGRSGYLRLGVAQRILGDEEVLERLGLVSTKCRHLLLQLLPLGEEGADLVS